MTTSRRVLLQSRGVGNQRGQALIELGMVLTLLMLVSLGILEFGRMLMIANMITQAARDGGRTAAVTQQANRDSSGDISGATKSAIQDQVRNQIRNVLGNAADSFAVATSQQTAGGGTPTVTVTITGSVNWLFSGLLFPSAGPTLSINRAVTFRDEGKPG